MTSFHLLLDYGIIFHKTSRILIPFHCSRKLCCQNDGDTIPSFFHTGSRHDQILHARLRVKCSSLKEHLYLKNIESSPLCTCGEVKSTSHYLLYCRKYDQERHCLFTSLNRQPPLSVLLYGDKNCSLQYNEHLFISVQKFIMQTGRFSYALPRYLVPFQNMVHYDVIDR